MSLIFQPGVFCFAIDRYESFEESFPLSRLIAYKTSASFLFHLLVFVLLRHYIALIFEGIRFVNNKFF